MMTMLRNYPDFEDVVAHVLLSESSALFIQGQSGLFLTEEQVGGEMPDPDKTFGATLPYVRIEDVGGPIAELTATPVIDVEVFASTRREAKLLSRSISTLLLGYAHSVKVEGRTVVIGKSTSLRSPNRIPYDDSKVARWGATYQLSLRR